MCSGRCAIHVAVLHQNEETVDYIASNFKQTLRLGDNVRQIHLFSCSFNLID